LLQVNAQYLTEPDFLAEYEVQRISETHITYLKSEPFWSKYNVPFAQAKYDKSYLFGILTSSCRQIVNKVMLENSKEHDGIAAWNQMIRNYDHGGSKEVRVEEIEKGLRILYSTKCKGGLTQYIERFQTLMAEMDNIAPLEFTDDRKQRLLIKNIQCTPCWRPFTQHCVDENLSYSKTAKYLRRYAMINEHDNAAQTLEPIPMDVSTDDKEENQEREKKRSRSENEQAEEQKEPPHLTHQETCDLFAKVAKEISPLSAYQTFSSHTIRQSLRISDNIWDELGPMVKDTINAIDAKKKEAREAKTATAAHQENSTDSYALHCQTVTLLVVQTHVLENSAIKKIYALSDSGADTCCLGKHCHPVSYTNRYAILEGYNPDKTRSGQIPIVSAYLKTMSQLGIPIVLKVNEAPYVENSQTTLISEYQVREHGIAVDSVAKHHKTAHGTYGNQSMTLSGNVYLPFVDRGGIMGFEILPWEEGDENIYEVFEITSDAPWEPHQFRDHEDNVSDDNMTAEIETQLTMTTPCTANATLNHDPMKHTDHATIPSRHCDPQTIHDNEPRVHLQYSKQPRRVSSYRGSIDDSYDDHYDEYPSVNEKVAFHMIDNFGHACSEQSLTDEATNEQYHTPPIILDFRNPDHLYNAGK
jgi:NACalpha-BTF3-like transcription factor